MTWQIMPLTTPPSPLTKRLVNHDRANDFTEDRVDDGTIADRSNGPSDNSA